MNSLIQAGRGSDCFAGSRSARGGQAGIRPPHPTPPRGTRIRRNHEVTKAGKDARRKPAVGPLTPTRIASGMAGTPPGGISEALSYLEGGETGQEPLSPPPPPPVFSTR